MKNKVPVKNYFILFGLLVLIITICMALSHIYNIVEQNKIEVSPLALTSNQITLDDLKSAKVDFPADVFIVIGYTKDKTMNNHEKNIKKVLTKNNLMDSFYYIDALEFKEDETYINDINNTLKIENDKKIKKIPAIIYISQGKIIYTIDSQDKLIDGGDIQKIIDMYEIASK